MNTWCQDHIPDTASVCRGVELDLAANADVEMVAMATELGAHGTCIRSNFITPALQVEVRADLDQAQAAGQFSRAGTGQANQHLVRDDIRRDQVYWPEQATANHVQAQLWAMSAALMQAFNRTLYLGLIEFEGHYAAYPQGGFYRRHVDSFARNDARMVSLILYLNRDWQLSDGGQLRMHDGNVEVTPSHVDIAPIGGTLVCFLSREIEHEVMPTNAARYSFTGWFKTARASK